MTVDLIIKNGNIFSKEKGDSIAVKAGKIIAVGSEKEIETLAGKETQVMDVGGNSVIPGFIDAHLHSSSCTELYRTKLMYNFDRSEGESRKSYIDRMMAELKRYCDENPDDTIIRSVGWNPAMFQQDEEGEPTREDLDRICPDRPMTMRSYDHHYLLVNSKALEMAGISEKTPDPTGGEMKRDKHGKPTGLFKEMQAINLVFDNFEMADFSVEEYKEGIMAFQRDYALPYGITGVFDAYASANAMKAYEQLAREGDLKIRVRAAWLADPGKDDSQFDKMISEKGKYDVGEDFKICTIKFFCDEGEFGFYTNEPFEKEILKINDLPEGYRGSTQWSVERMGKAVHKLSKAGYQIHVHCMGDAAVKHTLDAFEFAEREGVCGNRNAIAHIMNIDDSDIARMAEQEVIASMQPSWPVMDSFSEYCAIPLLGKDRVLNQYPMGRIKRKGVTIASGTDFPVLTIINPFIGIQIGITRTVPKSSPGYEEYKGIVCGPEGNEMIDCMSLDEMIDSYTFSGAYEMFLEDVTGTIEPGKSADILILDRNLDNTDTMDIEFTKIETLILKGEILQLGGQKQAKKGD